MDGRMKWAKHISSKNLNGSGFILIYIRYLLEDTSNAMNFLHTQIVTLKRMIPMNNIASFIGDERFRLFLKCSALPYC